jgi:hypothetical protein
LGSRTTPTAVWSRRLEGYPSDISIDSTGHELIVATIPSPDRDGGTRRNQLLWLGPGGRSRWSKEPSSPIRAVSMAADGSLAVVSDYEDQILAYDAKGKLRWSMKGTCVPFALSRVHKVICYHDDDAEPLTAFDILDWNGKKLGFRSAATDIVAFKVSADERNVVIGLAGGEVQLFGGPDLKLLAQVKVEGEVADLSPTSGEHPEVAILFQGKIQNKTSTRVAWLGKSGALTESLELTSPADQIVVAPDGSALYAYGNTEDGQFLTALERDAPGSRLGPIWRRATTEGARYDQPVFASAHRAGGSVLTGFEDSEKGGRVARIVSYDRNGGLAWSLLVKADESAYLYALAVADSDSGRSVAVATDDGRIAVYRIR